MMKAWISRSERRTNLAIAMGYLFAAPVALFIFILWLEKVFPQHLKTFMPIDPVLLLPIVFVVCIVAVVSIILFAICLIGFGVLLHQGITGKTY